MLNNKFIVLEGIEGSGKTTLINRLKKSKKLNGIFTTREPGGRELNISEKIRNLIFEFNDMTPMTEFLLFSASRSEHVDKVIIPHLKNKEIVLCDRYIYSSIVYQGIAKKIPLEDINKINSISTQRLEPSLIILLDLDPVISLNRKKIENRFDKNDISFHKKIREGYLEVFKNIKNILIVDGTKNQKEIFREVEEKIIKHVS